VDTPDQTGPAPDAPPATRWFQRVLPTTALGLAILGLAVLVVPGFRDQVELSVSRQPQPFVELYFAQPAPHLPQVVCARHGDSARVRFALTSHLQRAQAVDYRVAVAPSLRGARTQREQGTVRVVPGESRDVTTSFTLRRGTGYTVSVRLPGLDQQLQARCPGRRA
jgi:hypothetical protein